jgi:hypothetical protein
MLIDFNEIKEMTIPGMNNGTGTMTAKMFMFIADKIEKLRDKKHRLRLEDANNDGADKGTGGIPGRAVRGNRSVRRVDDPEVHRADRRL